MTVHNWNVIFAHKWPDSLYETALTYLKTGTLPNDTPVWVRRTFMKRMKSGYSLGNNNQLVLEVKYAPWNVNRNNKNVMFQMNGSEYVFKVIKASDRNEVLKRFMDDPKTISLNAHTLFDKLLREGYLGITRRYIHTFLTTHPSALNVRMHKSSLTTPIVQSFRPEYPFQHWQMDLTDFSKLYKDNAGYRYLFVIIDIFTKFVYLFPLKHKGGETQSHLNNVPLILNKLFLSGDIPDILHSDNGNEFRNREVSNVCNEFKVRHIFGKSYSPQTQGFVENKNKQIKGLINAFFIKHNSNRWFDILDRIAYTINNSKHFVTGFTPMQLHRGRDINLSFRVGFTENGVNDEPLANIHYDEVNDANLENYYQQTKNLYNRRTTHVSNILKSEATKREMVQEELHADVKVGSIVKIATYVKTNDAKIQGVVIKIPPIDTPVLNPVIYKENGQVRHITDTVTRPATLFSKTILKKNKFYFKLFKVSSVIKLTPQSCKYTLVEFVPPNSNNNNSGNNGNPVLRLKHGRQQTLEDVYGVRPEWSVHFYKNHLIVLNPQEFNRYANLPTAPRPNYLSMVHIDYVDKTGSQINNGGQYENNNNNNGGPNQNQTNNVPNQNNNVPNQTNNVPNRGETAYTIDGVSYKMFVINMDGNCMFHAVVKGLRVIRKLPILGTINTPLRLRAEVVRRNHAICLRNTGFLQMMNASNNTNERTGYVDCDDYKRKMGMNGVFGGDTELARIYDILNEAGVSLLVYEVNPETGVLTSINTFVPQHAIFVRIVRVNRNHYNTLLPLVENTVNATSKKQQCTIEWMVGPNYRRFLKNVRIKYNFSHTNKTVVGYAARIKSYIGKKTVKEGPFMGQRAGSFFEIVFDEVNQHGNTYQLELRPELYKSPNQDGWVFEDEKAVIAHCEKKQ